MSRVELPDCVKGINSYKVEIPMDKYSDAGMLFPDSEYIDEFNRVCTSSIRELKDLVNNSPVIVTMNFEGIKILDYRICKGPLTFAWETFRGNKKNGLENLTSGYINLSTRFTACSSPWQALQNILEGNLKSRPVATASMENAREFSLVGNRRKADMHEDCWKKLLHEEGWVNGIDFVQKNLSLPQIEFLSRLYTDGLAFRIVHQGRAYFRATV